MRAMTTKPDVVATRSLRCTLTAQAAMGGFENMKAKVERLPEYLALYTKTVKAEKDLNFNAVIDYEWLLQRKSAYPIVIR